MLTKRDFETIRNIIAEAQQKLKEDMLAFKDEVLHEITSMRDEIGILVGYRDMIEDHENRLQKLEK